MTPLPTEKPATQKRYELISRVLRNNIQSGHLPEGFVLLEGPIAELMQSSRAPVQMALKMLEEEKLIQRFDGRGFLVGQGAAAINPKRIDIRTLDLHVTDEIDEALQSRSMWEQVYDQVEEAVASSLIFGEFRIIETELSVHLDVSRTVVRDVLSRLNERGLIRKNQSSHWIAGPLTAQSVRDRFAADEYRSLFRLIERRLIGSAADYLENHLKVMAQKSLARLKIVAVISESRLAVPYLTKIK